jgi:hypothetical protein
LALNAELGSKRAYYPKNPKYGPQITDTRPQEVNHNIILGWEKEYVPPLIPAYQGACLFKSNSLASFFDCPFNAGLSR